MKRLLLILIAAFSLVCHAQDVGVGMEISGFRVPDYDKDGKMRAQLFGEHAKILENSEAEITNIKIELYKDGVVALTVFSPHCFYSTERNEAYSDAQVMIEMGSMTLVGRGFVWSAKGSRFEILNDAKIVVVDAAKQLKELKSKL